MVIGIASTTNHTNDYFYHKTKDPYNYAWSLLAGSSKKVSHRDDATNYGDVTKSGDIIGLHLDFNAKTIGFSKNGKFLGVAFRNIYTGCSYRIAVQIYHGKSNQIIEMVDYINFNSNNESKQNQQNQQNIKSTINYSHEMQQVLIQI